MLYIYFYELFKVINLIRLTPLIHSSSARTRAPRIFLKAQVFGTIRHWISSILLSIQVSILSPILQHHTPKPIFLPLPHDIQCCCYHRPRHGPYTEPKSSKQPHNKFFPKWRNVPLNYEQETVAAYKYLFRRYQRRA
jgi:hypothetical protein